MAKKQALSAVPGCLDLASFAPLDLAKVNLNASGFARDQGVNAPDLVNLD
jgi:hypothetical protein